MEYLEDPHEVAIQKTIEKIFGDKDSMLSCAYKLSTLESNSEVVSETLLKMQQINKKLAENCYDTFGSTLDSHGNIISVNTIEDVTNNDKNDA